MDENYTDIVEEYFRHRKYCNSLDCAKVIFEPQEKKEWFFDEGKWCYFKFLCDDNDYRLIKTEAKDFDDTCILKDMSYEIKMLLSFVHLRNISAIEKDVFSSYVNRYENAKKSNPSLTLEKFNFDIKMKEEEELEKSQKTANRILTGCLGLIILVIIAFGIFILSMFFAPSAAAKSKYTPAFIQHFVICRNYSESKFNTAYNSKSTYEIKGFAPDGSGKCVYVETHTWQRGTSVITCYFSPKQMDEYYKAMINPDIQGSVLVKGMPVVGQNEEVTFLKYFNDPKTCQTQSIK